MERAEADPFVGRTLDGKYLVEELLGWGAMGSVYRARQVALERTVALKVMSPELAKDPEFVARFHREAKTASRLWHPNTVSVTDFGEAADGLLYLVMELVPGRNLDEIIQQEWPLGDARVVSIVSQVLSAVAAAHDLGIIHRDLKPENLLVVRGVDDEGAPVDTVKVCDFGLARGLGIEVDEIRAAPESIITGPKLTSVGLVLGTPAYMSPEQAAGMVPEKRSDLYAVGAILFELLTKETPFERETAHETVLAHISDPVRDPRDIVPDCNPALAALCVRALAKEPNERPPTARAMRAAIQRALAHPEETTFPSLDDGRAPESTYPSIPLPRTNRPSEIRSAKPPTARTTVREAPTGDPVVTGRRRRWPLALGLGLVVVVASAGYLGVRRVRPVALAVPVESAPPPSVVTTAAPVASSASPWVASTTAPAVVASGAPRTRHPAARPVLTASVPGSVVAAPPVEPAPPPPPVIEVPAPVAVPLPTPPSVVAPAAPAAAFVPEHATVAVTVGEVSGTSRSTVTALVSHVTTTDCYQNALRALGRPEGGQGTMHLDFDEDGVVTSSAVKLPPVLSAAAECFRSRMLRQRLGRPPDTGSASGDLVIKLVP